jgi:hypothetical protein
LIVHTLALRRSLWALRRLVGLLDGVVGVTVPVDMLASELGLGGRGGRQSPIVRSMGRLVLYGMAEVRGDNLAAEARFRHCPVVCASASPHVLDAPCSHHEAVAAGVDRPKEPRPVAPDLQQSRRLVAASAERPRE